MIIRVSQKLGKKIKAVPADCLAIDKNPYADWSAHLFLVNREQHIIVTNTRSLYSVLMHGAGITNIDKFMERASFGLRELLTAERASFLFTHHIVPAMGSISISKMGDRRVIGSMNDLIHMTKFYFEDRNLSLLDASIQLNTTPMSMFKYGSPAVEFLSMNVLE